MCQDPVQVDLDLLLILQPPEIQQSMPECKKLRIINGMKKSALVPGLSKWSPLTAPALREANCCSVIRTEAHACNARGQAAVRTARNFWKKGAHKSRSLPHNGVKASNRTACNPVVCLLP